jgi:hypothetical protein
MKTLLTSSIFFTLIVLIGCKTQEVYKKEGVAIFAPTLNATYFFPFKNHQANFELNNFMENEYDTGFILSWYQEKWKYEILDSHSMPLENDNTFKNVAHVSLEYLPLKALPTDSIYSFTLEYSGLRKEFIYDSKGREFREIKGLVKQ